MTSSLANDLAGPGPVRYRRARDVVWRTGRDRILARRRGGRTLDVNGAGALVWLALDLPRSCDELHHAIVELAEGAAGGPQRSMTMHELTEALELLVSEQLVEADA